MSFRSLFVTKLYEARLPRAAALNTALAHAMRVIAREDRAGRVYSAENKYPGYTSYSSLEDLPWRDPTFAELKTHLDEHVALFARELDFDLGGKKLSLDSLWINILEPRGVHSSHIHPHSAISGTYYVETPEGSGGLKLEDPRLPMMMAAPPRKARAAPDQRSFHYVRPRAGDLLLWESWLRHEVERNEAKADRLSVSFNYRWG